MRMLAAGLMATALSSAPAEAADPAALCAGWAGTWRVLDDSELRDGDWTQDLSDGEWRVEATGPGKCRFIQANGTPSIDIDTTHGFYDVTNWDKGKPAPVDHYRFITSAIENSRSWHVVLEVPRRSDSSRYSRMAMTMTGDLFTIMILSATAPDAPYLPRGVTIHRRVVAAAPSR